MIRVFLVCLLCMIRLVSIPDLLVYPVAGVIVTEDFLNVLDLHDNESLLGTITALYDVGCFFGAIGAM